MPAPAKITIRVAPARSTVTVRLTATGQYLRLPLSGTRMASIPRPVLPNSSQKALLQAILAEAVLLVDEMED